eukprot:comp21969_c1_seq1/m.50248 comp21969_c1_seq1/g.50248  ORF comp21969_c1_seq1/g.50248 comp21969_c1_seq1/m.50248 type:complete len:357 (+) comp21969_c1_seq1:723-1793(+)
MAQLERTKLLADARKLLAHGLEPVLGCLVLLLGKRCLLDRELELLALHAINHLRLRVELHTHICRSLVDKINRLVRQLAACDVARGELSCSDQGAVLDLDTMMGCELVLEPAQNGDGLLDTGLVDHHLLEAALECRVLFDILAVLGEGGGTNAAQLAARKHRLEQVGRIHGAIGLAGTKHGVDLVDEENDLAVGLLDLVKHGLEALLELAAVLCARNQRTHVERHKARIERLWDVLAHNALRKPFDDGSLADTGLADEHWVVLCAACKHLDHTADLLVAANHGIELALACTLHEICAVLFERLIVCISGLAVDLFAAAHGLDGLCQRVLGESLRLQHAGHLSVVKERLQQMVDTDM